MTRVQAGVLVVLFAAAAARVVAQVPANNPSFDARAPVLREHRYVLNAKIRPLLFWISRSDVGRGQLTWRQTAGGSAAYELLIGSIPESAPFGINRWSYVREEPRGAAVEVIGLLRDTEDESLDAAKDTMAREATDGYRLVAHRATVRDGEAVGGTTVVHLTRDTSFRQLTDVLEMLPPWAQSAKPARVPSGVRPGFLTALAEMTAETRPVCGSFDRWRHPAVSRVRYLYRMQVFDLAIRGCRFRPLLIAGPRRFENVVETQLEVRNLGLGTVTRIDLAVAADGERAGVPVRAVFRPHWWLEVDAVLDDTVSW